MRARRALLYVPGNELEKIKEAITMGVDCICLDLEFGVPLSEKQNARSAIVHALNNLDFRISERLVRINPVRSDLAESDLLGVLNACPDGIVLPKVDSPERLQWVNRLLNAVEAENKWSEGLFKLHATIESAQGVINLPRICDANERLVSLIFGADDITIDLGATRTKEAWEMFYARSAVVLHASAFGLHAIDMLYPFDDIDGLAREARMGEEITRNLGEVVLSVRRIIGGEESEESLRATIKHSQVVS
ncbi:MAG: CoA ester lyase, partial [Anaerolineaceae bacterium]|nr:CoA ester lyase [Anaerolineaceae bacterium]